MYTALYRKYRPATFGQVVGQTAVVTALQNQVRTGRVGHSYLFTGTRGTGKTSCAKIFARAINCQNPQDGEPCGQCPVCRGLLDGSIFDVSEIDAASNNGVDDVRELREETAYIPALCKYRVYIIDEVHMLSDSAFNALLKIMEEPPAHVVFILATTEVHKVPATIRSRCQRFDFRRLTPQQLEELLYTVAENEGLALEKGAAVLLSRLADGAARDALSLLDTCVTAAAGPVSEEVVRAIAGVAQREYLFRLSDAVQRQDIEGALAMVGQLMSGSIEVKRLTEELLYHYRNLLLAGLTGTPEDMLGAGTMDFEQYQQAAASQDRQAALRAVQVLGDTLEKISRGNDPRIQLEMAMFDLCRPSALPQAPPQKKEGAALPKAAGAEEVSRQPLQTSAASPGPAPPVAVVEQEAAQPPVGQDAAPVVPQPAQNSPENSAPQPFAPWPRVIEAMAGKDQLLHAYLSQTTAYLQGRRVLIDGSSMFMDFMRANDYTTRLIKETIAQVAGEAYPIGPYKKPKEAQAQQEAEGIVRLRSLGVPIEYQ